LGYIDSPLFTLQQPFDPDEGWTIIPNEKGRYAYSNQGDSVALLRQWATNRCGLEVINSLPAGSYFIVRSRLHPTEREYIYVGNEAVRATPNMRVLLHGEGPVDSIIIGSPNALPPRLDHLLIGVVICHPSGKVFPEEVGRTGQHLVVFFSFGEGKLGQNEPTDDIVAVVPITGELVVDHLQLSTSNTRVFTPVEEDPSFRGVWENEFALEFTEQLASA
jgi:hypothetical protein